MLYVLCPYVDLLGNKKNYELYTRTYINVFVIYFYIKDIITQIMFHDWYFLFHCSINVLLLLKLYIQQYFSYDLDNNQIYQQKQLKKYIS